MKFTLFFGRPKAVQIDRWERIKAKGKKRFLFRVGMLQWGGFMFLFMTLPDFFRKSTFPRQPIDYAVHTAIGLLVWPAAGYLFGLCMWAFYENYFSDSKTNDS